MRSRLARALAVLTLLATFLVPFQASAAIEDSPGLSVEQYISRSEVNLGEDLEYFISVRNTSNAPIHDLTLYHYLDNAEYYGDSFQHLSGPLPVWGPKSWDDYGELFFGRLNPGEQIFFTFKALVSGKDLYFGKEVRSKIRAFWEFSDKHVDRELRIPVDVNQWIKLDFNTPGRNNTLTPGTTYRFKWDSSNVDSFWIGLEEIGGSMGWIATSVPNVGYFDWKVPEPNKPGDRFRIRFSGSKMFGYANLQVEEMTEFFQISPSPFGPQNR